MKQNSHFVLDREGRVTFASPVLVKNLLDNDLACPSSPIVLSTAAPIPELFLPASPSSSSPTREGHTPVLWDASLRSPISEKQEKVGSQASPRSRRIEHLLPEEQAAVRERERGLVTNVTPTELLPAGIDSILTSADAQLHHPTWWDSKTVDLLKAFYAQYNPVKVSQAEKVLSCPLYPTCDQLNKTLRRQYGEDLDSFNSGKTRRNWLAVNLETQELKSLLRKEIINVIAPLLQQELKLSADSSWTGQVSIGDVFFDASRQAIMHIDVEYLAAGENAGAPLALPPIELAGIALRALVSYFQCNHHLCEFPTLVGQQLAQSCPSISELGFRYRRTPLHQWHRQRRAFFRLCTQARFGQWKSRALTLSKCLSRHANRILASVFAPWRHLIMRQKRIRNRSACLRRGQTYKRIVSCVGRWKLVCVMKHRRGRIERRSVRKVQNVILFTAFGRWLDLVALASRSVKSTISAMKCAQRWRNRAVFMSLDAWRVFTFDHCRKKALMARAASRTRQRWLGRTLLVWSDTVKKLKWMSLEWMRHAKIIARFSSALTSRVLRASFSVWWTQTDAQQRLRSNLRSVVSRWRNQCAARAFWRWKEEDQYRRRRIATMVKASSRMRSAILSITMRAWYEHIVTHKAEAKRTDRQQRGIRRILMKMWNQTAVSAFGQWMRVYVGKKALRARVRRVLIHWTHRSVSRCMKNWIELLFTRREQSWRHATMLRIARKITSGVKCRAFDAWGFKTQKQIECRAAILRMQNHAAFLCFQLWSELIEDMLLRRTKLVNIWLDDAEQERTRRAGEKRRHTILQKVASKIANRQLAVQFWSWHKSVDEQKVASSKCRRLIARLRHRSEARSLDIWRSRTAEKCHQVKLMRKAVSRMYRNRVSTAMHLWGNIVIESRMEKRRHDSIVRRVLSVVCNRSLFRSFKRWVTSVTGRRKFGGFVARFGGFVMRGCTRILSAAFNAFREGAALQRHRRQMVRRVVGRWRNQTTCLCLTVWRSVKRKSRLGRRFLWKMQNRITTVAMTCWRDNFKERCRRRLKLFNVIQRWALRSCMKCLVAWHEEAVELKRQAAVGARALLRWRIQVIAKMFVSWEQSWSESKRLHLVATKVVRQWQLGALARAWAGWKENSQKRAKQRGSGSIDVMRLANRVLFKMFLDWSDHAAQIRHQRVVLQKMLRRMHTTLLYRAWVTWEDHASEMRRQRNVLEKIAMRMKNTLVYKSWNTWRGMVQPIKRHRRLVSKTVANWCNSTLAAGLLAWRTRVQATKSVLRMNGAIVARWMNWSLSQSFFTWCRVIAEERQTRSIMERIVSRIKNRAIARAFTTWNEFAEKAGAVFFEQLRLQNIMKKIMIKLKNRRCSTMLLEWKTNAAKKKAMLLRCRHLIARLANQMLACSLSGWRLNTEAKHQQHTLMLKVVSRIQNRRLGAVWNRWIAHVEDVRRELIEETRRDSIKRVVLLKLRNRLVSEAFWAWFDSLEIRRESIDHAVHEHLNERFQNTLAGMFSRFVARVSNKLKAFAFEGFRKGTVMQRSNRYLVDRTRSKMQTRRLDSAMFAWKEQGSAIKRQNIVRHGVVKRMQKGALIRSFSRWHSQFLLFMHQRLVLYKVVQRFRRMACASALCSWRQTVKTLNHHRNVLGRVVSTIKNRKAFKTFALWCANTQKHKSVSRLCRKIMCRLANVTLDCAFQMWSSFVQGEHQKAESQEFRQLLVSRARARCHLRCLKQVWYHWKHLLRDVHVIQLHAFYREQYEELEKDKAALCKVHVERSMELKTQVEKAMSEIQRDREELLDEFLQLHENAETQVKRVRQILLRRVLDEQKRARQRMAFESWVVSSTNCHLFPDAYGSARLFAAMQRRVSRVQAWVSFRAWSMITLRVQQSRNKILQKISRQMATVCFGAWRAEADKQHLSVLTCDILFAPTNVDSRATKRTHECANERMSGCQRASTRRTLKWCLHLWRTADKREMRGDAVHRMLKLCLMINTAHQHLSMVFHRWRERTYLQCAVCAMVFRMLDRIVHRLLTAFLVSWNEFILQKRRSRAVVGTAQSRMRRRLVLVSINRWAQISEDKRRAERSYRRLQCKELQMARIRWNRHAVVVFDKWLFFSSRQRRIRDRLVWLLKVDNTARMRGTLTHWYSHKHSAQLTARLDGSEAEKEKWLSVLEAITHKFLGWQVKLQKDAGCRAKRIRKAVAFDTFADRTRLLILQRRADQKRRRLLSRPTSREARLLCPGDDTLHQDKMTRTQNEQAARQCWPVGIEPWLVVGEEAHDMEPSQTLSAGRELPEGKEVNENCGVTRESAPSPIAEPVIQFSMRAAMTRFEDSTHFTAPGCERPVLAKDVGSPAENMTSCNEGKMPQCRSPGDTRHVPEDRLPIEHSMTLTNATAPPPKLVNVVASKSADRKFLLMGQRPGPVKPGINSLERLKCSHDLHIPRPASSTGETRKTMSPRVSREEEAIGRHKRERTRLVDGHGSPRNRERNPTPVDLFDSINRKGEDAANRESSQSPVSIHSASNEVIPTPQLMEEEPPNLEAVQAAILGQMVGHETDDSPAIITHGCQGLSTSARVFQATQQAGTSPQLTLSESLWCGPSVERSFTFQRDCLLPIAVGSAQSTLGTAQDSLRVGAAGAAGHQGLDRLVDEKPGILEPQAAGTAGALVTPRARHPVANQAKGSRIC